MRFRDSAEVFKDAYPACDRIARYVRGYLERALQESEQLGKLEITVRYIPIIMPEPLRARYPARSKLRRRERLYDCAPQLEYETFVDGSFEQQIDEYIRGLSESVEFLPKLGATPEQVSEFESILGRAKDDIVGGRVS